MSKSPKKPIRNELEKTDHRIALIQKALVSGSVVTRVFSLGSKYEIEYTDPKNGPCRTIMAYRNWNADHRYVTE